MIVCHSTFIRAILSVFLPLYLSDFCLHDEPQQRQANFGVAETVVLFFFKREQEISKFAQRHGAENV